MKILFVAPVNFSAPTGVTSYFLGLANGLRKESGCELGFLSILSGEKTLNSSEDLSSYFTIDGPKRYHWNPWFVESFWLDKIEKEFGRPDLVHFHDLYHPFQCALAIQMSRRGWKYIVSLHGGLQEGHQKRKFIKKTFGNILFSNTFLRKSIAIHVLNETERISFQKMFPRIRVFVLPNGVSEDVLALAKLTPQVANSFSEQTPLRFGFIGRIDIHNKGVDLLLKAVKLLQDELNTPLEFIFVGNFSTKNDEAFFMKLVSSLHDPKRVIYAGPMIGKDKWDMLSSFDIFILTSRYEGMPGAVIEAMAFGKPCLVTPGTNMKEIIEECQGGWAVHPSVHSIAEKIIQITNSKEDLSCLGRNAQEYVKNHLTWDLIARDYLRAVRNLLDKNIDSEKQLVKTAGIIVDLVPLHKKILEIIIYIEQLCREHNVTFYLCGGSALGAIRHQGFIPWDDDLDIFMTRKNYAKFIHVCRANLDTERFCLQEENTKEWPLFYTKLHMNNTIYSEKNVVKGKEMNKGIFVDIFPLDNCSNNIFLLYLQYVFSKLLIAKTLDERGYLTNSKLKKAIILFARIFIRWNLKKILFDFIKSFNKIKTHNVGSFFGKGKIKTVSLSSDYFRTPRYVKFETTFLPVPERAEDYLRQVFGDYMKIPENISPPHAVDMK